MDEPDFDENDLINDDMDMMDEEPLFDDYDEEMMMESPAEQFAQPWQQSTTTTHQPPPLAPTTMHANVDDVHDDLMNAEDGNNANAPSTMRASQLNDTTSSPIRQRPTLSSTKKDVFSFERYSSGIVWRPEKAESPQRGAAVLKATEWKKNGGDGSSSSAWNSKKTSTSSRNNNMPTEFHLLCHHQRRCDVTGRAALYAPSYTVSNRTLLHQPRAGVATRAVTLRDGSKMYFKQLNEKENIHNNSNKDQSRNSREFFQTDASMVGVFERVKAKRRLQAHTRNTSDENEGNGNDSFDVVGQAEDDSSPVRAKTANRSPLSVMISKEKNHRHYNNINQLWVDKHAPHSFPHLLSDDRTNREVIRALRAWDPFVFHKEAPPRPEYIRNLMANKSGTGADSTSPKPKEKNHASHNPKDKRPEENRRVILLSGSPGVGKTTLAHIAARHCGYRAMEVNGSDDRSADVLTDRVLRAMESTTLHNFSSTGERGRPNCLILDEIDGADANGAIKAIVDIIRAEISTGKKKAPYLRRPIIFICNNKYAPALRPLLPYAVHFNVEPPTPDKLVTRLRAVLKAERLSLIGGSSLLHQLVSVSGGDIRYCLFALQFAATRVGSKHRRAAEDEHGYEDISTALTQSLSGGGLKDTHSDVVGVLTSVFQKRKRSMARQNRFATKKAKELTSELDHVHGVVSTYGDNSRLLDLLFLNAIRVSFVDPTFDRCATLYEWLSHSDTLRCSTSTSALTNSSLHYAMQNLYLPTTASVLHCLCRVEQRQELTFSDRELSELHFQKEANMDLATQISEGISPHCRTARVTSLIGTETASYTLWILSAGQGSSALDRSVSTMQLLKDHEKEGFNHHADILRTLGLTYQADATTDYANNHKEFRLRLEPPLQRFVRYTEGPRPRRRPIPDTLKELLALAAKARARQQDPSDRDSPTKQQLASSSVRSLNSAPPFGLESRKKRKESPSSSVTAMMMSSASSKAAAASAPPLKKPKAPVVVNASNFLGLGAKKAKEAKTARKMARVGLDSIQKQNRLANTGSGVPLAQVMRLKYTKGFTQAVRIPCRLDDLE